MRTDLSLRLVAVPLVQATMGGGSLLAAPTLALLSGEDTGLLEWSLGFPAPEVGDVVTLELSATNFGAVAYTDDDTITDISPVNTLTFDFGGALPDGTYYARAKYTRSGSPSAYSNVVTAVVAIGPVASGFLLEGGSNFFVLEGGSTFMVLEG